MVSTSLVRCVHSMQLSSPVSVGSAHSLKSSVQVNVGSPSVPSLCVQRMQSSSPVSEGSQDVAPSVQV